VAQYLPGVEVDALLFGQSGGNGNEAFDGKDFALVGVGITFRPITLTLPSVATTAKFFTKSAMPLVA
jgi:hypothetical protein